MPTNISSPVNDVNSASPYFTRVLGNDALRKGVAAAAAGALIALVTEALWPSDS